MEKLKIFLFALSLPLFLVYESIAPTNLKYNLEYRHVGENGKDTSIILFKEDSLFFYQELFDNKLKTYGNWSIVDDSEILIKTRWKPIEESKCNCRDVNAVAVPGLDFENVVVSVVRGGLEITFDNKDKKLFLESHSISFSMRRLIEYYENL